MSAPEEAAFGSCLREVNDGMACFCKTCGVEIRTAAAQPKHQLIADLIGVCIACFDAQNEGKDGEGSFFEPLVSCETLKFQTCILCGAPGAAWSGPLMDQVTTFCFKHAVEFAETKSASGVSIVEQAFERAEAEFDQQRILAEIHRDMRYITGWNGEKHEEEQGRQLEPTTAKPTEDADCATDKEPFQKKRRCE